MYDLTGFARKLSVEDSSQIAAISYSPDKEQMIVEFKDKKVTENRFYLYRQVPSSVFGTIAAAESVGKAFNKLVHDNTSIPYEELAL